jgi:hypothetical protein
VTIDELCRELDEGSRPTQAVAITFDDGYRDVYTNAFPILRKYGVPATVFLTASAIETGEIPWYDRIFALAMLSKAETLEIDAGGMQRFRLSSPESRLRAATDIVRELRRLPNQVRIAACAALEKKNGKKAELPRTELQDRMLTWAQIREMQAGGISFGAHTMSHPAVSRLQPEERQRELVESRQLLEQRLQNPVEHFAFPFGLPSDIGEEIRPLMPAYGYRSAASTVWGVNTPATDRYLLRRIGAEETSLPLFALRLRRSFLDQQTTPLEMKELESAIQKRAGLENESAWKESEMRHA